MYNVSWTRVKKVDLSFHAMDKTNVSLDSKIDPVLEHQFAAGRLYASIASRPGQVGRCDGYILEGKELEVSFDLEGHC
jgi:small subunit ribosomal protein S8e